ncbi:DNA glycosylase AlkZ-like family protein [Nocardioides zeae]|uniref:ArsR family transcriptional regulator n=1 Tax=Nocardioides zeae TaxID=1457234 RepID=A0A6P0HIH9_9ACTN|nr:crosslink repair DNA glycosylase YcaQ family protein [Nocardioides zeae]NEN78064.1 ArsR family transcriptional regulator [Nocardioides zeae]
MHKYGHVTPTQLNRLIAAGETYTVEFKRGQRAAMSDNDIVDAAICLANGDGGLLLIGVEDDGRVTGLEPRHGSVTQPHLLQAMILNRTESPLATSIELVELEGKEIAVIDVPDVAVPVGSKSGKYVRRSLRADGKPECVAYPLHEMLSVGLTAQGRDYAATPARGASLRDLDRDEFERFRRMCATGKGDRSLADLSDVEILKSLRLVLPEHDNQLTLGAVLLFGSTGALEQYVPTAEVVFQEMRNGSVAANETLRLPLLRAAERLFQLINVRNSEQELVLGLHRIGIPRVPDGTIRESIANALVHRDYSEIGPVSVQLSEDRFRVRSPGGFPPGITLQNLLDDSKPRSPILAEAFKRAGIVDRAGRGVREMYTQLLRAGRGGPDYSATNDNAVIVQISTSDADLEMVRFVLEYEDADGRSLLLPQLQILHELKATGPQTTAELVEALREAESSVRTHVARLTEMGLVESRGTGRHRRHHLTAAFYRLAQSSEYVRLRDTDPIQQEHMILAYVDQFGSITRGKTAELCHLSPGQARTVLKRLTEAGELELRGERRGAHYVRRSTPSD